MVDQFTYNNNGSRDSNTLTDAFGSPGDGVTQGGGESSGGGGGGGASSYSGGSSSSSYSGGSSNGGGTTVPTSRLISFTIKSTPKGASILVDGNNTGLITPHTIFYSESELLTPKQISLINGANNSVETYMISSEIIKVTTDGTNNSDNYGGGYGGSSGGGFGGGSGGGGGFDSRVILDGEPVDPSRVNFDKPREAQK